MRAHEEEDLMTTGARRPLRILLVDDERRLATTMERWLSEDGHAVEALHDGAAGLRRALDNSHDVLILDVRLPSVDGLEICRQVRAAGGATPILLCSGRAAVEDRVAGFTAGADDYLIKPFALPELGARVHALGRRPGRGSLRAPDAPPTSQPRPTVASQNDTAEMAAPGGDQSPDAATTLTGARSLAGLTARLRLPWAGRRRPTAGVIAAPGGRLDQRGGR